MDCEKAKERVLSRNSVQSVSQIGAQIGNYHVLEYLEDDLLYGEILSVVLLLLFVILLSWIPFLHPLCSIHSSYRVTGRMRIAFSNRTHLRRADELWRYLRFDEKHIFTAPCIYLFASVVFICMLLFTLMCAFFVVFHKLHTSLRNGTRQIN